MVAQNQNIDPARLEALGPAERAINTLTTYSDHLVHNRPGIVVPDRRTPIGVRWDQATWVEEGEDGAKQKVVYRLQKVGRGQQKTRLGVLSADGKTVRENGRVVGEYRKPGLFPEAAVYLYRQIAEVFKLDNEFAAHWASWAFARDHKDMKVILAAFMLVQNRCGEPEIEDGEVLFFDDDFRSVGEAMCLITTKGVRLDAKLLLRIGDLLAMPGIVEINREMGFGKSARSPVMGRYKRVVTKWLRYREQNPKMLAGLVKAGGKRMVQDLARRVNYKPLSAKFFETLGWKQTQSKDGHRKILDVEIAEVDSWQDLSEAEICQKIVDTKPNFKLLAGKLPSGMGLTRAIVAAAIEAGSVSDADLIILTPTLEELGLLKVKEIKDRLDKALQAATNQRAANIARNVKSKDLRESMEDSADQAVAKAVEEVVKDLMVAVIVDKSGSMEGAIERAKDYLSKLLIAFPLDRLFVSVFNTMGTEVKIQHSSKRGVEAAFRGHNAGGGTTYAEGVRVLAHHQPKPDQDVLVIFVGDEGDGGVPALVRAVEATGWNPVAFGLMEVNAMGRYNRWGQGTIVKEAAQRLGIPCFKVDEAMFEADDPYVIPRTLRNLIESTPVGMPKAGRPVRKTLVQTILETPLLAKPVWA